MFQVASARGPELARQEPASAGWRQRIMLSQLVIKQVWGKHSFNKSQLAAYLTREEARSGGKPTPVAPSPLGLGGCTTPPSCGFAHHDIWRAR